MLQAKRANIFLVNLLTFFYDLKLFLEAIFKIIQYSSMTLMNYDCVKNRNRMFISWWCRYSECRGRRGLLHLYVCRFECRNSKKYVTQLQNMLQRVVCVTYFFEFPSIKIMCNVFFIFLNRLSML